MNEIEYAVSRLSEAETKCVLDFIKQIKSKRTWYEDLKDRRGFNDEESSRKLDDAVIEVLEKVYESFELDGRHDEDIVSHGVYELSNDELAFGLSKLGLPKAVSPETKKQLLRKDIIGVTDISDGEYSGQWSAYFITLDDGKRIRTFHGIRGVSFIKVSIKDGFVKELS